MRVHRLFHPKALITAAFIIGIPILVGTVATLTGLAATPAATVDVIEFDRKWLVSVDEARALIASGALVLDARNRDLKASAPLANAQSILFQDLSDKDGQLLADDAMLNGRLQELGVDAGQPVVVVGDPFRGLGEDAQIVWALRSLGHPRVVMVDGGLPALVAAGLPTIQRPYGRGAFVVSRLDDWVIDAREIKKRQQDSDFALLPSAIATDFLTDTGTLQNRDRIDAVLAAKGVSRDSIIAAVDTGPAVAWLTTVLIDLGYNARLRSGKAEHALTAAN